jgi:hypothetical protein
MKSSHIFGLTIMILMAVAVLLIVTAFNQPLVAAQQLNGAAVPIQVTATPISGDDSVIGSTDGIVAVGVLIVVIILTPLAFRKKYK